MKPFSHLSIIRGVGYLLVFILCVNCKKDYNSTDPSQLSPESISQADGGNLAATGSILSQTMTATILNNFGGVYVDNYPKADAEDVAADDGIYAYTRSLSANGVWYASLALQGFGFTIPDDATIVNIEVKVRRFKKGRPSIKDYFVSVMQRYGIEYGVEWTNLDTYPGNYYPGTEGEVNFLQSGSGTNGGYRHDQTYQWTPAMVNHPYFGLRIDVYPASGPGSVVVYYDYVQIKVEYSQPATIASKSPDASEANRLIK